MDSFDLFFPFILFIFFIFLLTNKFLLKENYLSVRKNAWLAGNSAEMQYIDNAKSPFECRYHCYRCPGCQGYCWNKEYNRCTVYSNLKNTELITHPYYECGFISEKANTLRSDAHIHDLLREKEKTSIKNYYSIPTIRTPESYYHHWFKDQTRRYDHPIYSPTIISTFHNRKNPLTKYSGWAPTHRDVFDHECDPQRNVRTNKPEKPFKVTRL